MAAVEKQGVGGPGAGPAARPPSERASQPRAALRFLTAGSVDDGKSTLIGRLLLDSRAILADQLDAIRGRRPGPANEATPDLALLTDGLEAEREQGITIDVAHRYFATPRRKFIIADAPGHEQYTRNMVTAAAGSDAAVVLVDITKLNLSPPRPQAVALLPQTRRHALLAQLLRVPGIVFAVNKLDALAEPGPAFAAVREALLGFAQHAGITPAGIVPISALRGDNVVAPSAQGWGAWYRGPTLLDLLEDLPADNLASTAAAASPPPGGAARAQRAPLRMPVQFVARHGAALQSATGTGEQPRIYWGRIAEGCAAVGDFIEVQPGGQRARIAALRQAGRQVALVPAGQSAGIVLDRQLDISRGDWIGSPGALEAIDCFEATLAWLDTEAATVGRRYWVRHAHSWVPARIERIEHRIDIQTLRTESASDLTTNQIGRVVVRLQQPLPLVPYAQSRTGGALIVVDPASHRTAGALLVERAS